MWCGASSPSGSASRKRGDMIMDSQDRKAIMDNLEKVLAKVKQDRLTTMPKMDMETVRPMVVNGSFADQLSAFSASKSVAVDETLLERHRILAHRVRSP